MSVCDKKAHVVSFHRYSSHDNELLGSLHQKTSEFVTQNDFNFIGLLDTNTHAGRIDGRFNQAFLVLIAADQNRIQNQFFA